MIRYLVEQGANIHQEIDPEFNGNIITPFKRAIELGYDEIVDFFKKQHTKKHKLYSIKRSRLYYSLTSFK